MKLYWLIPEEPTYENVKPVLAAMMEGWGEGVFIWPDLATGIAPPGVLKAMRKRIIEGLDTSMQIADQHS